MARTLRSAAKKSGANAVVDDARPPSTPTATSRAATSTDITTPITSPTKFEPPNPKTERKAPKSRMPIPATISYPSLDTVTPQKMRDYTVAPETPTTVKKPLPETPQDESPMPGAFDVPADSSEFTFDFKSKISEAARQMLEDVQDKAREYRSKISPTCLTPARPFTNATVAATTERKTRFSDAHRSEFAKMKSIADSYAAKRPAVTTPQNPQKGIKRTQSQATLEEKSLPPTPSPVKKRPDQELIEKTEGREKKRVKVEEVSSFASRIGLAGTPRMSTRPPPSAARTAVARRVSQAHGKQKPLPALPRNSFDQSIRLVPSSVSRIPVTPSSRGLYNLAPATVAAAPKFALSRPSILPQVAGKVHGNSPSTSPKKSAAVQAMIIDTPEKPSMFSDTPRKPPMFSTGPISEAKPRVTMGVLSPVKLTETEPLEDPFGSPPPKNTDDPFAPGKQFRNDAEQNNNPFAPSEQLRRATNGWGFNPPTSLPAFPKVPTHDFKKRKASESPEKMKDVGAEDEESGGARKRTRFGDKAQNLIDRLSTPKKRVGVNRNVKTTARKVNGGKPLWK